MIYLDQAKMIKANAQAHDSNVQKKALNKK
jgi:hypothetical protein